MSAHSSQKKLASTACWIAAVRAQESVRANRLFHDPWASSLAGQEGQVWRERMTGGKEENEVGLVIRTRFLDDFLQRVTWEHQVRQVVIMATGMDTRAFRLSWPPHTHLFELDFPSVFERKERLARTDQRKCGRFWLPRTCCAPLRWIVCAGTGPTIPHPV